MKITLIYKNEPVTLKVPESLAALHKEHLLSSADLIREMRKAYIDRLSATGQRVNSSEIKGTLIK
jgi:hypothetical protein